MKTVVLGDQPPALASLIAERKRLGLDRHDEVWHGEYHMAPAANAQHGKIGAKLVALLMSPADERGLHVTLEFNLGDANDFRVPDLGVHRDDPQATWLATAVVVVEIRSPDDETYDKLGFYFDHGVDELLIADLVERDVHWYRRGAVAFEPETCSDLLGLTAEQVSCALGWG
jgi:Uma2 family endonuclease